MQKILVIDDDRDMCLLLKKFLLNHGFNVSVAYSSKQALEILEVLKPDLVLCDFRLDIIDGKTVLLKIKQIFPSVPVIIITGYQDIKIAVEVMKLGAYDYITKPIIPGEMILTITNALKQQVTKPVHIIENPSGENNQAEKNDGDSDAEQQPVAASDGQYIFQQSRALTQIITR